MSSPPVPPSVALGRKLPSLIEELTLACLAKEPTKRPKSAAEVESLLSQPDLDEPWTQAHARKWWSEHRADLQRLWVHRQSNETPSSASSAQSEAPSLENLALLTRALD